MVNKYIDFLYLYQVWELFWGIILQVIKTVIVINTFSKHLFWKEKNLFCLEKNLLKMSKKTHFKLHAFIDERIHFSPKKKRLGGKVLIFILVIMSIM